MNNPVTVVIPIYGKAEFAFRAVKSVIEHVNLTTNNLLVINDGGPEKEEVKTVIEPLLSKISNANYVENETNLGFVLSSNRAVQELDDSLNDILILNSDAALTAGAFEELVSVLNTSERHAVVVPRTSHGTIASFPINPRQSHSEQESYLLFLKYHKQLPRYSIVPTAPGFCILFNRNVIENYGFFDPWFSPGYDEENDFCLRVNQAGYSTLLANHAFVFHAGSQSFGEQRPALQEKHEKQLLVRYPHFPDLLKQYHHFQIDPIDMFSDYLGAPLIPQVLIDCSNLGLFRNGTSTNIVSFLDYLSKHLESNSLNWEVTILASRQVIDFYELNKLTLKIISVEEGCDQFFDVGVAVSPIWNIESLFLLSQTCARIVVSHLDIIALRIGELSSSEKAREIAALSALEWADRTVFISESARRDVEAYSPDIRIRSSVVIPQGNPIEPHGWFRFDENFHSTEGFVNSQRDKTKVLVIGNSFPHKQVKLSILALEMSDFEVVALGSRNHQQGSVRQIKSGLLTEETIQRFYSQADVVVIPSAYEGYGLPIPQALAAGKPLVVFDTETAREVVAGLSATQNVTFFQHFSELKETIDRAVRSNNRTEIPELRSIVDYNSEFVGTVSEVLSTPVDIAHLRKRVRYLRSMEFSRLIFPANSHWVRAQLSRKSVRWSTKFADVFWGPIYRLWKANRSS